MNTLLGQVEWTKVGDVPVFEPGDPGSWDSHSVTAASLVHEGDQYTMWYGGNASSGTQRALGWQIGCAHSTDLINWKRNESNPWPGAAGGTWDVSIWGFSVLHDNQEGIYKLWYAGYQDDFFVNNTISIGYATAPDCIAWERWSTEPVLKAEGPGSWEFSSASLPSVMFDGAFYRMWYTGQDWNDHNTRRIGLAASPDGQVWTKYKGNPVLTPGGADHSVSHFGPHVRFDERTSTFEMWYRLYTDTGGDALGYATSMDGITWCKANPWTIAGEFESLPFNGPVLFEGDTYRMLYRQVLDRGDLRYKVAYATAPWTLPKASFTATPDNGVAPFETDLIGIFPLEIAVDAARSTAPALPITQYIWDFGDGQSAEGIQMKHTYSQAGEYLLKLTVTDSAGKEGSVARKVVVDFPREAPPPWTADDIGQVSGKGGARIDGDCFEVLGAPGDIGVTADAFHFVHRKVEGDFRLTAQVAGWDGEVPGEKIGLMARAGLGAGAPHASVFLQKYGESGRFLFLKRLASNGGSQGILGSSYPGSSAWLRLERRGNDFIASTSLNGTDWTDLLAAPASVAMPPEIEVGIAATDARLSGSRDYAKATVCQLDLETMKAASFRRGDANSDGAADISDAVAILGYLFLGETLNACLDAADVNDDGLNDISDPVALLGHLFLGEPEPPAPFPGCGADSTEDALVDCRRDPAGC